MTIDISTPALLFPAVSLLFLSYTNRFLALSALIRKLHTDWIHTPEHCDRALLAQITNLRRRLKLIRWMQVSGALSLFLCVTSMGLMLYDFRGSGTVFFATALSLMAVSLVALVREAYISGGALNILLDETGKSAPSDEDC
ncbi:DUF2721 domain-containing protein [Rubritalea profundi]|uniref:II family cellulose-binding protein n=1 Tax=Rubritalea profundi TaxID=1658618 RepID=A0A2S7U3Q4_9BACT|nr:DUF2721 domain-containing protein [Rubritalea profundi]PQJ29649.1 hypothetical protein BSZ32_14895 [Rubritalea profundi]